MTLVSHQTLLNLSKNVTTEKRSKNTRYNSEKFITWKIKRINLREAQPVKIYPLLISPAAWVSRKSLLSLFLVVDNKYFEG